MSDLAEIAGLAVQVRAARRAAQAARAECQAHLLKVATQLFEAEVDTSPFPPPTVADRAWMDAHWNKEFWRLGDAASELEGRAWSLERALLDACLRVAPGE